MADDSRELTLLLPGLLPPFPEYRTEPLERWLARANPAPAVPADYESLLFHLFGLAADEPLPVAPVSLLGEGHEPGASYWLRADPVSLEADQAQIFLNGNRHLGVTPTEAERLTAELNTLLAEDDCLLVAPHPHRWYLRTPEAPELRTHPMHRAIGSAIHPYQPEGAHRPLWQRRVTELQMLLHASAVNSEREGRGDPAVNSVWLWGGGQLPAVPERRWAAVWSTDPLARGLARLSATADHDLPQACASWVEGLSPGRHLLALEGLLEARRYGDRPAWEAGVGNFVEQWLAPLAEALRRGRLQRLSLLPGAGRVFLFDSRSRRRWWRRSRPLEHWA